MGKSKKKKKKSDTQPSNKTKINTSNTTNKSQSIRVTKSSVLHAHHQSTVAYAAVASNGPIPPHLTASNTPLTPAALASSIDPMQLHPIVPPAREEHIVDLPFIIDFQTSDNETLTRALLEEQNYTNQYEELHKLLSGHAHNRPDVDARLKAAHDDMEEAVENATREVLRHYRQMALKMHPDKHGESFRPQFELLTVARDVLKDPKLRHLYLRQMISVVLKVGKHYIQPSHQSWILSNQSDVEPISRPKARFKQQNQQPHKLQQHKVHLEGGLFSQKPRLPHIKVLDTKSRLVHIVLPVLKPEYQFYQYIHRVDITFTYSQLIPNNNKHNDNSNDNDNNHTKTPHTTNNTITSIHKLSLTRSQIVSQKTENTYPTTIDAGRTNLPFEGTWYASWNCSIIDTHHPTNDGSDNTTVAYKRSLPSSEASIDIISDETIRNQIRKKEEEQNAVRAIGRIDAVMVKLREDRPKTTTSQYNVLHSAIVRGRVVERRLFFLLKVTGEISFATTTSKKEDNHDDNDNNKFNNGNTYITNKPYNDLHQKIQDCAPTLKRLQVSRYAEVKKDALKMFKHHVATILETDPDVMGWIRTIQNKDLLAKGGDANRLYQLFLEGKGKAFVLELDSDLLEAASKRDNLFTVKQCKDLKGRAREVKLAEEREEDEEIERGGGEKEEEEEKLVHDAIRSLVGDTVKFKGLASENGKKLNGKLGKVTGYVEGNGGGKCGEDRYSVEYIGDLNGGTGTIPKGKVFSVKAQNLERDCSCYFESASSPSDGKVGATNTETNAGGVVRTKETGESNFNIGKNKVTTTEDPEVKQPSKERSMQQQQSKHLKRAESDTSLCSTTGIDTKTGNKQTGKEANVCAKVKVKVNMHSSTEFENEPWSCSRCTFHHEGEQAFYIKCCMCDMVRGSTVPGPCQNMQQSSKSIADEDKIGTDQQRKVLSSTQSTSVSFQSDVPPQVNRSSSSSSGLSGSSESYEDDRNKPVQFEEWMADPMPTPQKTSKIATKRNNRNRNRKPKKVAPPPPIPSSSSVSSSSSSSIPFELLARGSRRTSTIAAPKESKIPSVVMKKNLPEAKQDKIKPKSTPSSELFMPLNIPQTLYEIIEHEVPPPSFKAADPTTGKVLCKYGKRCRKPPGSCTFAHPETCKTITILELQVGSVIGKNGWHIREIVKESGAFMSVDTKNKIMVQGQKAMMVHFAGTQKATEDAIKLVKNCLLIYDGENIGELQFGGTNTITPTLPKEVSPVLQKTTPQKTTPRINLNISKQPNLPNRNKPTGWGHGVVATEKNMIFEETTVAVSKSNSNHSNLYVTDTNFEGTANQNKNMSEYFTVATNGDSSPTQNTITQAPLFDPTIDRTTELQSQFLQRTAVPTEIFNRDKNVHDPVLQQLISEASVVSSLEDFSHLKESDKIFGGPIRDNDAMSKKSFVSNDDNNDDSQNLLSFLISQAACIKGDPEAFFRWLVDSEDITSISDLSEAISDPDYVHECLQAGNGQVGLKGFKRNVFKKAVLTITMEDKTREIEKPRNDDIVSGIIGYGASSSGTMATAASPIESNNKEEIGFDSFFNNGNLSQNYTGIESFMGREISNLDAIDNGPPELYCPISHELMTKDPVLAPDGITYERCAIEDWFARKQNEIQVAKHKLTFDPALAYEKHIVERGIVSPVRDYQLPHLTLTPNISIRNMARDYMCKTNMNGAVTSIH